MNDEHARAAPSDVPSDVARRRLLRTAAALALGPGAVGGALAAAAPSGTYRPVRASWPAPEPWPGTSPRYARPAIASLRAAPGVEGHGADTAAGRGGRILVVTNTDRAGPGSLAEALATPGPRRILFDVAGDIVAPPTGFAIEEGEVSVYGQTARGEGICIRAQDEDPYPGVRVLSTDILFQHVRFRAGPFAEVNGSRDTLNIGDPNSPDPVGRIVFDHCTMSWGTDETVDIHSGASHVTLSRCLIYEGLAKGTSNHADTDAGQSGKLLFANGGAHHLTIVGCVLAMGHERLPLFQSAGDFDFYNNVVYGSTGSFAGVQWLVPVPGGGSPNVLRGNFQDNVFIDAFGRRYGGEIVLLPPVDGYSDAFGYHLHVAGNRIRKVVEGSEELEEINLYDASDGHYAAQPEPIAMPRPEGIHVEELEARLLPHVGASRPVRDSADERVVREIVERTGSTIDCVGGKFVTAENDHCARSVPWPELRTGPSRLGDTPDRVPRRWKLENGLDPDVDASTSDSNDDGYLDIEDWLLDLARDAG